ncbi:unnamed protein product [Adineta ricciae]|uniref:Uncharacterized protein n=1 Tax=Adineta ricciae TaxID=249248 RepID=A0A814NYX9_ADIRI|nr:unnamed protein product [Adineta ricciae]
MYTPTHLIDTHNCKQQQQSTSKLVNRYLSTAAQYLNRTKSFHVTPTNSKHHYLQVPVISTNASVSNLAPSISNDMHTTEELSFDVTPVSNDETNSSSIPLDESNNNSINVNKTQGLVNTLRRSLRKNKERFYNKQSTAMKSCHSLNTHDQPGNDIQDVYKKMSMTPTLHHRRQHLTNNTRQITIKTSIITDDTNSNQTSKK